MKRTKWEEKVKAQCQLLKGFQRQRIKLMETSGFRAAIAVVATAAAVAVVVVVPGMLPFITNISVF
jgi:hypothetical protein